MNETQKKYARLDKIVKLLSKLSGNKEWLNITYGKIENMILSKDLISLAKKTKFVRGN